MSQLPDSVGLLGAGRMGRGIALSCALAGVRAVLLDMKERPQGDFDRMAADCRRELHTDLASMAELGLFEARHLETIAGRISVVSLEHAAQVVETIPLFFEGVPEVVSVKAGCLQWASRHVAPDAIIASTTSTILVNDLSGFVSNPERFANAHWLNPAYLMPLVEVSRSEVTSDATLDRLLGWLTAIGKVPVCMKASPGYIVPRIQALALNEAARMVEEGVASAEDIDKAVKVGFGIRFATLGLCEFIDWGGGDILYHGARYLAATLDQHRFKSPQNVEDNMKQGRNGLRDGIGFYDYRDMDVTAYRKARLAEFVGLLKYLDLAPRAAVGPDSQAAG